jgi:Sec7-like guanine-nucleotide exchange factor
MPQVMYAYVDAMEFSGMAFDEAIRSFLSGFRYNQEEMKRGTK